jgi:hypothetical protein
VIVVPLLAWALAGAVGTGACVGRGYSYAGYQASAPAAGVAARLTLARPPTVRGGHAAAWIGFGAANAGESGTGAWVHVGIASFPGGRSELYYEFLPPTQDHPTYVPLRAVAPREQQRVALVETAPDTWAVLVKGRPVSPPIVLPGSHADRRPVVTAESWDGGPGARNDLAYGFGRLAIRSRPGGQWKPFPFGSLLQDQGFRTVPRRASFTVVTP